jgi:7-cyano-7-deazaguanine reductase
LLSLYHSVDQSQYIGLWKPLKESKKCERIAPNLFLPLDLARKPEAGYNKPMAHKSVAPNQRYTDEHAKAGLDFNFPAIETWQNQFPGYEILIDDPELTSVCPKTGLPDFGVLTIRYMPREKCLELKSLKEYLFSYRNLGIFQENIVNQVLEDVVKAADPVWTEIKGVFRPRGGIGTTVIARYPRPTA